MMVKRLIYVLTWLLISAIYLYAAYWLQSRGFFNLEAYFLEYKKIIFHKYSDSLVNTFYFTSPALLFLSSLVFGFTSAVQATFVVNAFLVGALTNHMIHKSVKGQTISPIMVFYLLLSPVIWYGAVSGGSLGFYLIFYFVFFRLLFKYTQTYSVYHLTLISILLGMFFLLDPKLLQLLLILIPVFFFVSFFKAKGISGSFYSRASMIFSNDSQRRKFFGSFFSSIIVVLFIPISALITFLLLNWVFGGSFFYFLFSPTTTWTAYSNLLPFKDDLIYILPYIGDVQYLALFFLLSIFLIYQIFVTENMTEKSFLLTLVLFFAFSQVRNDTLNNLNLNFLSMMTGAAIAASGTLSASRNKEKKMPVPFPLVALIFLSLAFKLLYFEITPVATESRFLSTFKSPQESALLNSISEVKEVTRKLPAGRILVDDAIFFAELTGVPDTYDWEGHFSPSFQQALQHPELYADYLIVTKSHHRLHLDDLVAISLKRLETMGQKPELRLLFENEFLEIHQIKPL
ncbi:hypothetical protein [Arthrospiribacter ruber]|uniref:Uncharacterized protein n=1 Tax=Arthrospiribacter ruber TaxID=2487934 RepID=A0A951J444_9BACT|nr:hypothetical protein [Arthrospiribacter ruber]MBW3470101.1 hypothetical protein [Arthrospiribacter ruber]